MGRPIKKGSTDQSTVIRIIDSTDGTPENAVEHNTAGIDLWYRREKETKTSITEAALASLDAAHNDGGIELIGDGYYRLDMPDAACAAGAGENSVQFGGTVTGMIVIGNEHALVDYDPYDSVRAGLTALPNAAADAAGGLPISDAGDLDLDAQIKTDIDAILTDTDVIDDGTSGLVKIASDVAAILVDTAVIGALGAGLTAIPWNSNWDAEVQSECADALTAYDPPTKTEMDTAHALLATVAKQDVIDGIVDTILVDTNELQGLISSSKIAAQVKGMDANVLTASALKADAVDEIHDEVIEGAITHRQMMRLILAVLTGKSSGGGTTTLTFRDIGDAKDRLVVTVDSDGNRSAVGTRDGS